MRGLLGTNAAAIEIIDGVAAGGTVAHAPDLIVSEVTNALRVAIHPERWPVEAARERLDIFLEWPLAIQSCRPLAAAALACASELGISAYDAFYAVLSVELNLPLLTADRRLAAAVPGAVLVQ